MRAAKVCLALIGVVFLSAGVAAAAIGPFEVVQGAEYGLLPLAIWQASSSDVFVAGDGGHILHFDGTRWNRQPPPLDCSDWPLEQKSSCGEITGLWGASGTDVFGLSPWGIAHYDGHAWSLMDLPWKIENIPNISYTKGGAFADWIWGAAGNDVYAVYGRPGPPQDNGGWVLLHYDGSAWVEVALPHPGTTSSFAPASVWGKSAGDVFVGGKGSILHYDGKAWSVSLAYPDPEFTFGQIRDTHGGGVFAVGFKPTAHFPIVVLMYYDGTTWRQRADVPVANPFIVGTTGKDVYFHDMQKFDTVRKLTRYSSDGWSELPASPAWAIGGTSVDDSYGISGNVIYHFDGTAWTPVETLGFTPAWARSARDVFGLSSETVMHYDGAEWATMPSPPVTGLENLWGNAGREVFAVGGTLTAVGSGIPGVGGTYHSEGLALHYDGAAWSRMDLPAETLLHAVWGASSSEVFAVGDREEYWCLGATCFFSKGTILRYDGSAWSTMAVPDCDSQPLRSIDHVWGASGTDVFALATCYSDKNVVLHYDGTVWTAMDTPDNVGLYGLSGSSGHDVYANGVRYGDDYGSVDVTLHYDGTAWSVVSPDITFPTFDPATLSWTEASANAGSLGPCATDLRCWGSVTGWLVGSSASDLYMQTEYQLAQSPILHYGPPGPAHLSASNGAPGGTVSISWDSVAGGAGFQVYRSPRGIFDYRMIARVDAGTTAYGDPLGCGSLGYDYKVAAVFADGSLSAFSPADLGFTGGCAPPTAPTLVSPSVLVWTSKPTFTWKAQQGTASYHLRVGQGATTAFSAWYTSEEAGCGGGIWTCSVTPATPLADGRWEFAVQGSNDQGTGPWTTAAVFDISTIPTVLTLVFPAQSQVVQAGLGQYYAWRAQPGVDSYQVWVGTGSATALSQWVSVADASCETWTGGCWVSIPDNLPVGTWFFNVRGRNARGTGQWTRYFALAPASAPTKLTLLAPFGPAGTKTPAFSWSAQAGVDSYLLWVGTSSSTAYYVSYTPAAAGCGAGEATCRATPGTALATGGWYFNVRGKNLAGTGPWAASKGFGTP